MTTPDRPACACTDTTTCGWHASYPGRDPAEAPPRPSADDLLGADPDYIGGMDVDEYIAMQRRR